MTIKLTQKESLRNDLPYYLLNVIDLNKDEQGALEQIRQDLIEAVAQVESIQYKRKLDSLPDVG